MKKTLQEDFALFKNDIGLKLDYLTREVKELKEGIIARVVDLEKRVRNLEDDGNLRRGDRIGISTVWKIVVTIMTIVIGVLSYIALIHPHG